MITWLSRHAQVIFATLGKLATSPISSLTTIGVIAITLSLPAFLYVFTNSAKQLSNGWEGRPQLSVYLKHEIDEEYQQVILEEIRLSKFVAQAELISADQALAEFKLLSGLNQELDNLGSNPLPASILVLPTEQSSDKIQLSELSNNLSKIDGVDNIALDLEWIEKFNVILKLIERFTLILSLLLGIAVVLIISNTIRLSILNQRDEIEITKLVGGTDSFIMRPFLYNGFFLGLIGAILAYLLISLTLLILQGPISQLSSLYNIQNPAKGLSSNDIGWLMLIGTGLGWVAARWSVSKHLSEIEPK